MIGNGNMKEKLKKLFFNSNMWMAALAVLLLIVMVFPLGYIAQYIWPSEDDFGLCLWCKHVWEDTGNIWLVIKRAVEYALYYWKEYQGTFSALFLMALQPGIWGDQFYWTGVMLLLVSLVGSTFTLTWVLMVKQAKAPKSIWLILTSLTMFAWLMEVMYMSEVFYWWTGASLYTGFHAWVMWMTALVACIYTDYEAWSPGKRKWLYLMCVVAFFLGGGNFLSALLQVLVLGGYLAAAVMTKRKNKAILAAYFVSALGALLCSVLAPGNSLRIESVVETRISVFEAVWISIRDGLYDIYAWTHLPQVLLFIFIAPFVWTLARSCRLSFRLPLLATILSGGLFLAQYMPCSYSLGGHEPGRIVNVYYWNFYWLILFNLFYWVGWIDRKARERGGKRLEKLAGKQNRWQPFYILAAGLLLVMSVGVTGARESNLGRVYAELLKGRYKMVDEFMKERVAYFELHQGEDVTVEGLPYKSAITYFADLFPDKDHVVNQAVAEYYGVKSVTLE